MINRLARALLCASSLILFASAALAAPPPIPQRAPLQVGGTPYVGQTLTVVSPPASATYQWYRDGSTAISGATNVAYTLQSADNGHTVSVAITIGGQTVSTAPVLVTLGLTPTTATPGQAYSGAITSATSGSSIAATSTDGTALTVSGTGASRTLAGTFASAGTPTVSLVETLAAAANSPRTTTFSFTVSSAAYAQNAVHFDQLASATLVGSAYPGLSDSPKGTLSFWYRGNPAKAGYGAPNTINVTPIWGNLTASSQNAEAVSGIDVVVDNAGTYGTFRVNLNDATGGNTAAHTCLIDIPGGMPAATWTHWLVSWDLTSANYITIYKNGSQVATGCNVTNYTGAYPMQVNLSSAAGFAMLVGNWTGTNKLSSGAPGAGEIADFFADFTTSILTPGTSTIAAGNIAKFYNGGLPVNYGTNCATPLGFQPQFCYRGNASSFFTNQGSLGNGGMTVAGQLWNAPASASNPNPSHTAVSSWIASGQTTTTSATVTAGGNTITAGDLLILSVGIVDSLRTTVSGNGCSTDGGGHCVACPTGFTQQYHNWNNGGSSNSRAVEGLVCTKIAGSGDAGSTTSYALSWTTAPSLGATWELEDMTGANQTTPVEAVAGFPATGQGSASSGTNFTASTNVVAPSVTPVSTNDTLKTIFFVPAAAQVISAYPSDEDIRIRQIVGYPNMVIGDRVLTSNAATSQETLGQTTSIGSEAVTLAIAPS